MGDLTPPPLDDAGAASPSLKMPSSYCAMKDCQSDAAVDISRTFYKFPKDAARCKAWAEMCGRSELQQGNVEYIRKKFHICDLHFNPADLLRSKLNLNAIPLPYDQIPKDTRSTQTTSYFYVSSDSDVQITDEPSTSNKNVTNTKRHYKKRVSGLRLKLKQIQDSNMGVRPEFLKIIDLQHVLNKLSKDKECSKKFQMYALMLYLKSPASYKVLRVSLSLPTAKQLRRINLDISPSMSTHVIATLQYKIRSLKENNRHCTVSLKKMSLKKFLFYHINKDKVIGFRNIDGVEEMEPATVVYVLMARGLNAKWEQLIGYCLVTEDEQKSNFDPWLSRTLATLNRIGYAVAALVVDHEDFFTYLKHRLISITHPQIRINNEWFPIYCIYDLPQLIISLRNMLMTHTLQFHDDDGSLVVADWEIIKKLYYGTKDDKARIVLPKLSKSHIYPNESEKKELKYAAEVFSKSVSDALETLYKTHKKDKARIRGTQKLTILVNDVFDILNSSSLNHHNRSKNAFTGEPHQMRAIRNFMEFLTHVKPVEEVPADDPVLDCIFGLRISIMSLSIILRDLLPKGIKALVTHRFNLSAIDSFFESTKFQAKSGKPTPVEFYKAFKKTFITQLMTYPRTGVPNDNLVEFINLINERHLIRQRMKSDGFTKTIVVGTTDYRFELPTPDSFHSICWYLLKKCYEVHKATTCSRLSTMLHDCVTCVNWATYEWDFYFKPPQVFINVVKLLDELLDKNFGHKLSAGLGTGLLMAMKEYNVEFICPCFPGMYLRRLFIRLRIYHIIRYNNRRFSDDSYKFSKTDYYNIDVL